MWRELVRALPAARKLDVPTLNDHIPQFLDALEYALQSGSQQTIPQALLDETAPAHGVQRVKDAFDIEEVVAEYNILRGCIHDLADRHGLSMNGRPFHVLNRVFDGAIGAAVQSFAAEKAQAVLARRNEYLTFVVHDLRTPLNAISLSANVLDVMLTRDETQTADTGRMLKALDRNVQRLVELIDKVIDENGHVESDDAIRPERREFDLWPLVETLIRDLRPLALTSATRLVNAVPEELVVYADASLIQRVLQNLIANAINYTPGGEVVIGAAAVSATGGSSTECFVRDNGNGIPAERLASVFDKNETDPARPGGLGLGLAIVKTFVEAHDGTVQVTSTAGAGSTFRFTLPGR